MKLIAAVLLVWTGCSDVDDDPELGEVESAATQYQATQYQATQYQATQYQATQYQATQYQATQYQGATFGGVTLTDNVEVNGTAIGVWIPTSATTWTKRLPNQICSYVLGGNNGNQRVLTGCTPVTGPSPLVGTTFTGVFVRDADQTTFTGTITVAGVSREPTIAMHPVGSTDVEHVGCDHPAGCNKNTDIWLYDLRLADQSGNSLGFCSATGTLATALAGVYDRTGQRTNSTTQFTFGCYNGTIAKCTRWGYRSFGSAYKYTGPSYTRSAAMYPLADYHQACVRAATADYCGVYGVGKSFTKNGTIVDIWDYDPSKSGASGFVPRTDGGVYPASSVTALVWESGFDKLGAIQIDHSRYQEAQNGSANSVDASCPGTFVHGSDDVTCPLGSKSCEVRAAGWSSSAVVWVDSTPACAHSELLAGKWLHDNCSSCTAKVKAALPYCTDPTSSKGWDSACVAKAKSVCTATQRMVSHSECTVGAKLDAYDSGCTLAVCLNPATSYCCTGTWDAACTNAANSSLCSFAKKTPCLGGSCALGLCAGQPTI